MKDFNQDNELTKDEWESISQENVNVVKDAGLTPTSSDPDIPDPDQTQLTEAIEVISKRETGTIESNVTLNVNNTFSADDPDNLNFKYLQSALDYAMNLSGGQYQVIVNLQTNIADTSAIVVTGTQRVQQILVQGEGSTNYSITEELNLNCQGNYRFDYITFKKLVVNTECTCFLEDSIIFNDNLGSDVYPLNVSGGKCFITATPITFADDNAGIFVDQGGYIAASSIEFETLGSTNTYFLNVVNGSKAIFSECSQDGLDAAARLQVITGGDIQFIGGTGVSTDLGRSLLDNTSSLSNGDGSGTLGLDPDDITNVVALPAVKNEYSVDSSVSESPSTDSSITVSVDNNGNKCLFAKTPEGNGYSGVLSGTAITWTYEENVTLTVNALSTDNPKDFEFKYLQSAIDYALTLTGAQTTVTISLTSNIADTSQIDVTGTQKVNQINIQGSAATVRNISQIIDFTGSARITMSFVSVKQLIINDGNEITLGDAVYFTQTNTSGNYPVAVLGGKCFINNAIGCEMIGDYKGFLVDSCGLLAADTVEFTSDTADTPQSPFIKVINGGKAFFFDCLLIDNPAVSVDIETGGELFFTGGTGTSDDFGRSVLATEGSGDGSGTLECSSFDISDVVKLPPAKNEYHVDSSITNSPAVDTSMEITLDNNTAKVYFAKSAAGAGYSGVRSGGTITWTNKW